MASLAQQRGRQALDALVNQYITPLAFIDKPRVRQSNARLEHKGFEGDSSPGHHAGGQADAGSGTAGLGQAAFEAQRFVVQLYPSL